MFKKRKPLIQFVSTIEGLETIQECLPRPTKGYIPDWFKAVPSFGHTVKACPSFPDFFSQGFVVPMWMDSTIEYNSQTNNWVSDSYAPFWDSHRNDQFLDYVKPYMQGRETQFVFKANCPWRIITPPGYSVLQLPLFYHFNQEFSVLPGIIDTDIHHEINQQVLYHGNGDPIKIDRGTPFVMYIPFKRTKYDLEIRYQTEKDRKIFASKGLNLATRVIGSGVYRQMQRERDKRI